MNSVDPTGQSGIGKIALPLLLHIQSMAICGDCFKSIVLFGFLQQNQGWCKRTLMNTSSSVTVLIDVVAVSETKGELIALD